MLEKPRQTLEERYYRLPGVLRALIEIVVISAFLCAAGVVVAVFSVAA